MANILVISGGWEGHTPHQVAQLLKEGLVEKEHTVALSEKLEVLANEEYLAEFDVIVPNWTAGSITPEQTAHLVSFVQQGRGLAGLHGGMGDAFRGNLDYEWMVGGHFVGHPYVGEYLVEITDTEHPVTENLPKQFSYHSEQYYMMVDPAVKVLACSEYDWQGQSVRMPVAWVRPWGDGRVFYSALGHTAEELERYPQVLNFAVRGICWSVEGK